jgi:hypothetical protein
MKIVIISALQQPKPPTIRDFADTPTATER